MGVFTFVSVCVCVCVYAYVCTSMFMHVCGFFGERVTFKERPYIRVNVSMFSMGMQASTYLVLVYVLSKQKQNKYATFL